MSSPIHAPLAARRKPRSAGIWALVGAASQVLFVMTWLLGPLWQRRGYRVLAHSISDLYAVGARGGTAVVIIFTACGAATIAFALLAVWPALRAGGWSARVGSVLLALSIFGMGDLLTPVERVACQLANPRCTPADQVSNLGGLLDGQLSTLGIVLFAGACLFLALAMSSLPAWRAWVWPTRGVAVAVLVLYRVSGPAGGAGYGGLVERFLATLGATGIAVLALRVLTLHRAPAPSRLGSPSGPASGPALEPAVGTDARA